MSLLKWFKDHKNHKIIPADNPAKNLRGILCNDCNSIIEYNSSVQIKEISNWRKLFYKAFAFCEPKRTIIMEDDFSMTQNYFHDDE